MIYPTPIQNLIECYKKLPGIGEKSAERMALKSLELDQDIIELFSKSLIDSKTKVKRCKKCNNLADKDLCSICNDKTRDKSIICVVQEPKNIIQFEKNGFYKGMYHVLDGLISPLDNINPDDINLAALISRINDEKIEEVIIAVKPSIEGETTSLYISQVLKKENIKVSKLAHGIPLGADMDYIDALTLEMALEERREVV